MAQTPKDILRLAIEMAYFREGSKYNKPGQIIKALSPEKRKILSGLTAQDVNDVREDMIFDDNKTAYHKQAMELLEKFDKEVLGII